MLPLLVWVWFKFCSSLVRAALKVKYNVLFYIRSGATALAVALEPGNEIVAFYNLDDDYAHLGIYFAAWLGIFLIFVFGFGLGRWSATRTFQADETALVLQRDPGAIRQGGRPRLETPPVTRTGLEVTPLSNLCLQEASPPSRPSPRLLFPVPLVSSPRGAPKAGGNVRPPRGLGQSPRSRSL